MKIVLAAVGFYERDIEYNRNKIIKCLKENSGKVDLILFGETFLQGFEALDWKYETDQHMALSVSDSNIQTIQKAAEENSVTLQFCTPNAAYSSSVMSLKYDCTTRAKLQRDRILV